MSVFTRRNLAVAFLGGATLLAVTPGVSNAIPVVEDVKIVITATGGHGVSVSAGSVQKPGEIFDITIQRVSAAQASSTCVNTRGCSLSAGGDASQPAVFVVNAVGHSGATADTLGTVFDSFQATLVCTTAAAADCTQSPTV